MIKKSPTQHATTPYHYLSDITSCYWPLVTQRSQAHPFLCKEDLCSWASAWNILLPNICTTLSRLFLCLCSDLYLLREAPLHSSKHSFLLLFCFLSLYQLLIFYLIYSVISLSESSHQNANLNTGILMCFEHKCVSSTSESSYYMVEPQSVLAEWMNAGSLCIHHIKASHDRTPKFSRFCPVLSLCVLVIFPPSLPQLFGFPQALVTFLQFLRVTGSLVTSAWSAHPSLSMNISYKLWPWNEPAWIRSLALRLTSCVTLRKLFSYPVP